MTLEFFLTALVIIASPGTGAIYTVAAGLSGGARASLVDAFGCTPGSIPHLLAATGAKRDADALIAEVEAPAFRIPNGRSLDRGVFPK